MKLKRLSEFIQMRSFAMLIPAVLCATAYAQNVQIRVHTVAAVDQNSPVRVVTLQARTDHPFPDDPWPGDPYIIGVVLENVTAKPVYAVQLESQSSAPPGCAKEPRSFGTGDGDTRRVFIEAGGRAQAWTGTPAANFIVGTGLWQRGRYLQVQVGVEQVYFTDGSSWKIWDQKPYYNGIFSHNLLLADAPKCADWQWDSNINTLITKWNDPETHRLRGIAHVRMPDVEKANLIWNDNEDDTSSYFYNCSIDLAADAAECGMPRLTDGTGPAPRAPRNKAAIRLTNE